MFDSTTGVGFDSHLEMTCRSKCPLIKSGVDNSTGDSTLYKHFCKATDVKSTNVKLTKKNLHCDLL